MNYDIKTTKRTKEKAKSLNKSIYYYDISSTTTSSHIIQII